MLASRSENKQDGLQVTGQICSLSAVTYFFASHDCMFCS